MKLICTRYKAHLFLPRTFPSQTKTYHLVSLLLSVNALFKTSNASASGLTGGQRRIFFEEKRRKAAIARQPPHSSVREGGSAIVAAPAAGGKGGGGTCCCCAPQPSVQKTPIAPRNPTVARGPRRPRRRLGTRLGEGRTPRPFQNDAPVGLASSAWPMGPRAPGSLLSSIGHLGVCWDF